MSDDFWRQIFASVFFSYFHCCSKALRSKRTLTVKQISIFSEAVVHRFSQKACNFIKKILQHRRFSVNFAKYLRALFSQNPSDGCFCFLWNIKVKMTKYIYIDIFTGKHQWWRPFFSTVADLGAYGFSTKALLLRCFYEICKVLQNLICTVDSWATPSSNILDISLAVLAINQLSHSWLSAVSRTSTKTDA